MRMVNTRNRFERRRTPPGFWETDMPCSQELRGAEGVGGWGDEEED